MAEPLQVLMLEDSEDDTLLTLQALRRGGYDPIWRRVDCRDSLLAALKEQRWDILLADFSLPRFNGMEALKHLKKLKLDLPFIILSGTIGEETAVEAMRAGASDYIMKDKMGRLAPAIQRELRDSEERRKRRHVEDAYRTLVEQSMQGIIIVQDFCIVLCNEAFAHIVGYPAHELLSMPAEEVFQLGHADDRDRFLKYHNDWMMGKKAPALYEHRFLCKDGSIAWVAAAASPIEYHGRPAIQAFYTDITERKKAEDQLKLEKDKLQTLIDGLAGTEIGIDIVGTDYRVHFQNRILRKRFGDLTGELCYEKYMGRKEPCDFCPMQKAIAANRTQCAEVLGVDGRYYELLSAPIPDQDGTVDKAIEVVKDITDRKLAEEGLHRELKEKEVLLKEIHHRVKNNLQVISSLLSLQSHHVQGERDRELFRESQDRVRSMALVHEKLYQSKSFAHIDFADYVKSLIDGLRRTYCINPGAIKIDVTAENVKLNIDLAVPCGLIINELISNAIKHAFPISHKKEGRIQIILRHLEKKRIELIVQDNGMGVPEGLDFKKTESLGLKLVSILVEDQLDGTIHMERKKGTKFRIVFQGSV